MDTTRYAAIGMELAAGHLTVVAVDLGGRRIVTWRRSSSPAGAAPGLAVAHAARVARDAIARVRAQGATVVGLTVTAPGVVDHGGGVPSAPASTGVELRSRLECALGHPEFPVNVDGDARLAALAEHLYGGHAGSLDLVCLAGQTGVDVGVIADGVPLRGGNGDGSELGHVPVDPMGPDCACGRAGCLATVAGLSALLRRTAADPHGGAADELDFEVAELARRAGAGEQRVLAALAEVGSWIGSAVGRLISLFAPQTVVLGGPYAALAPWTLPAVERAARSVAATADHARARLAVSTLGYQAAALGGAASALTAARGI